MVQKLVNQHFVANGYEMVDSAPLIARGCTVPFCISGGVPFEKKLSGKIPVTKKVASIQTCLRTSKIDSIGKSGRHHICFEMIGHFSFGYDTNSTKTSMILSAYGLLIKLGLSHQNIAATVDREDFETLAIWQNLGVKVFVLVGKKVPEATRTRSGLQSEILYKITEGEELENYRELWNLVFYQFATPKFSGYLETITADSGASLDRILSAREGVMSNYLNSNWLPYLNLLEVNPNDSNGCHLAELAKACVYLASEEDFFPGNKRGPYEFRKIIRRLYVSAMQQNFSFEEVLKIAQEYFIVNASFVVINSEIEKFKKVLSKNYQKIVAIRMSLNTKMIEHIAQETGFPVSLILQIQNEGGISWL